MFLRSIYPLQTGLMSTNSFIDDTIFGRTQKLEVAEHLVIERLIKSRIQHLEIDDNENRYLLSCSGSGGLFIHDLQEFDKCCKCPAVAKVVAKTKHGKQAVCATWFPGDNSMFVSSGDGKTLKLWDTNIMRPVEVMDLCGNINNHQSSPILKSQLAVASHKSAVELIDFRTGHRSHKLRGHRAQVMAVAWSPLSGPILTTGAEDGEAKVWDIRSSASHLLDLKSSSLGRAHNGMINGLTYTRNGLHILTYGNDKSVRLWDSMGGALLPVNFGRIRNKVKHHVQIAVSDTIMFVPSNEHVYAFSLLSGLLENTLSGTWCNLTSCTIRHPYQDVYTGAANGNILVWSADIRCDNEDSEFLEVIGERDNWSSDDETSHN